MPLTARRPSQELVNIVGSLGGTWSGYVAMCRCPAHADSDPSLSIRQGDRSILVTCFAGCAREDVLRELGRIKPGPRHAYPVFDQAGRDILFYVGSRGHHADIGGITPGSMPADSTSLAQEGIVSISLNPDTVVDTWQRLAKR